MKKQTQRKAYVSKKVAIIVVLVLVALTGFGAVLEFNKECRKELRNLVKERGEITDDGIYINVQRCFVAEYDTTLFSYFEKKHEDDFVFFHPTEAEDPKFAGVVSAGTIVIEGSLFHDRGFDAMKDTFRESLLRVNENAVIISEKERTFLGQEGYEFIATATVEGREITILDVFTLVDEEDSLDARLYLMKYIAGTSEYENHIGTAQNMIDSARYQAY